MRYQWQTLMLGFIILALAGCGPANPLNRQPLQGRVTLDGEPLDDGRISFRPHDASSRIGSGAVIQDGRYEIAEQQGLPPGKYLVRISAPLVDPTPVAADLPPGTPVGRVGMERIPAEFNQDSDKVVEVTAAGDNVFDFDIRSVNDPRDEL